MPSRSVKQSDTPLGALSKALCNDSPAQLFSNQVVMFQLLVPFISDQLSFPAEYNPSSVDTLIVDIQRYLSYTSVHPNEELPSDTGKLFSSMHRYIYSNLAKNETKREMPPRFGQFSMLSLTELRGRGTGTLDANISNVVHANRPLPLRLRKLFLAQNSDYTPILCRCFWILQYYLAYYLRSDCIINRQKDIAFPNTSSITEYYSLNRRKLSAIYRALRINCSSYSSCLSSDSVTESTFDLLTLSRVIIDVLISQINLLQRISLEQFNDININIDAKSDIIPEPTQYREYQRYLGGFGEESYDRYITLLRYAPTNCYAAEELASAHYWGRSYWIRDNNYYEVEQDYSKAAEWFQKAIENSSPPHQGACWSLSYTITNMHYDTPEEQELAEAKAKAYLKLAGDYPAAQNRLAGFLFRDAAKEYRLSQNNEDAYKNALSLFAEAIQMADQAASQEWFYGNNQIAVFLETYGSDTRLITDLSKRLKLQTPLDLEAQLRRSASYHGPWALKHLALYLIHVGRKEEALTYLKEAMKSNYNLAYFETARHFHVTGDKEWTRLMTKASEFSCPIATYELARNATDEAEKDRLITLCRRQVLSERNINAELLHHIDLLQRGDLT